MKKHIKIAALLLVMAMSLTALAGCGEDEGADSIYSQGLTKEGYFDITTSDYVTIGDYSHIPVSQASMDELKDYLLYMYPGKKEIEEDRAAVIYDTVNIDFTGYLEGVPFENGAATNQEVVIGEGRYIGGFEEGIIGHKKGETFTVDATFPDDYPPNPDLAGKVAQFEIKLNGIYDTFYYDEMTDEFVANNFYTTLGVATVEEMNDFILYSAAIDVLEQNSEVKDPPQSMIDFYTNVYIENQRAQAEQYSMTLDQLFEIYGTTEEEVRESYLDQATNMAHEALIYQAIAEDQGLKVSNEDLRDYFLEQTGNSYYTEYKKTYGLPYLKYSVLNDKVRNMIYDNIEIQ